MPLIIKGIATVEDAEIALEHGVEVIYVSNHGGRQLDHGLGSMTVLPEVVKAVAGRAEVWVDGFMRGRRVKAIALGAKTVAWGACPASSSPRRACRAVARARNPETKSRPLGLLGVPSFPNSRLSTRPLRRRGLTPCLHALPLLGDPRR